MAHRPSVFRSYVTTLTLVVASGLVVLLASQTRQLRNSLKRANDKGLSMFVGSFAPLGTAPTPDGDTVQLGSTDGSALIYFVYNTRCPYCERSIVAWTSLYAKYGHSPAVRIWGISLDSLNHTVKYRDAHSLQYESVIMVDPRQRDAHRFNAVPQTIVLDSAGRVRYSRLGVLEGGPGLDSVMTAVEALLNEKSESRDGS